MLKYENTYMVLPVIFDLSQPELGELTHIVA